MKTVSIEGKVRTAVGRTSASASRREGSIPCTLYGKGENISFEVSESALRGVIYTPDFFKVMVNIEGKEYETLVKDIQFHPVTDKALHLDFFVLNPDKKLICEIPVHAKGLSVGVKAGGKLAQKIRKVKVKLYPKDLVDKIYVDVTHLEMGRSVRISDLETKNMEILGSPAIPVITCTVPRSMRSKQSAEAAEAGDAAKKVE